MKIFISILFLTISLSLIGQTGLSDSLKIQSKLDEKRLNDIERLEQYVQDFLSEFENGENPEFNWFRDLPNGWGLHREIDKYSNDLIEPLSIDYIFNNRSITRTVLIARSRYTYENYITIQ